MPSPLVRAPTLAGLLGSWRAAGPTYLSLAAALEGLVLDGRIALDARVPAERELAVALGVSRTTVAAAYADLRSRGFLRTRRGSGSRTALPGGTPTQVGVGLSPDGDDGLLDLATAAPVAPRGLALAAAAAAQALPAYLHGHGYQTHGLPRLRALIAERYGARGLPTSPDQIVVTSGALGAINLVLRASTAPGDRVLVEQPTYPNALEAIRRHGVRTVPVPLGEHGWDVDLTAATARESAARLAYVVADFHNPTGLLMDDATRGRLATALHRARTMAVVDETLVDLDLGAPADGDAGTGDGPVPPPFASYALTGDAVLVGSASKSFWGGLGVGWLRAPTELVPQLLAARVSSDLGTSLLAQLTVAELLADRDAVLAERRRQLAAARDALASAVRRTLPDWRVGVPRGGLSLWCQLPAPVSSRLVRAAAAHGLRLAGGPRFGVDGTFERFLRLPYTRPADELVAAMPRLAAAYASLGRTERLAPDDPRRVIA